MLFEHLKEGGKIARITSQIGGVVYIPAAFNFRGIRCIMELIGAYAGKKLEERSACCTFVLSYA